MPFSIKPILAEISRVALADKVVHLIEKCAESESTKMIAGTVAAAAMPVVIPAVMLVGLELLNCRGERKQEEEFQEHCREVVKLLGNLEGRVEEVAGQLDDLIGHRTWVWARISGADQDLIGGRVVGKIESFLKKHNLDTAERLEDVRIYSSEILATLDDQAQTLARIEAKQTELVTKDDLEGMADRLLSKLQAQRPGQTASDPGTNRDLVAAVERLASDAARGGVTARQILESDQPSDLTNYLAARREQLNLAQQSLNQRIDEEKVKLDRELAAVAFTTGQISTAEAALHRILALLPGNFDAINSLGHIHLLRGSLDEATKCYRRVLRLARKDQSWKADAYRNLGNTMRIPSDLDRAEVMYRKALAIDEKLGRLEGMARDYGNLGLVMQTRGDLDGAEAMHRKSLAIEEKLGGLEGMAIVYGNLGIVMGIRRDLDGAGAMFRKALAIDEKLGRLEGMANQYGNLGIVMQTCGNLNGAEAMFRKALAINEKLGRLEGMAIVYGNLGIVMKTRRDREEAREMWMKSRELFARLGAKPMVDRVQGLIDGLMG